MNFTVIQGDIAAQEADVLVNAAGTSLRMGSGVAGALRRGAEGPIDEEARGKGPIELGEVVVTDAYSLAADYVIHAAAMPHYGDGKATEESIRTATRNALATADELGCASVVLPALGCGVAGFDLKGGVHLILDEVAAYEPTTLADVRMIGYGEDEVETIRSVARAFEEYVE